MNRLLFFLISFLFLNACTSKKESISQTARLHEAKNGSIDIGEFETEIIPLKVSEEALLGSIHKSYIDKENDRIFVLSMFNVWIFDGQGEFIARLDQGRGPGEVLQVASFSVNSDLKQICVLDMGRALKFYDYAGKFLRHIELDSFYSMDLQFIDNENLFLVSNYVGGQEKQFVGKYNISENEITDKFIHVSNSPYVKSTNLLMPNSFSYNDSSLLFFSPSIFALFENRDSTFYKIIDFDLGSLLPPADLANNLIQHKSSTFASEIKKMGYVPQLLFAFQFRGFYFVGLDDETRSCYAINKANDTYSNGSLYSYFGLPEVPSLSLPVGMQENTLIFACNPSELFDDLNEGSKTIEIGDTKIHVNSTDNPVLIVLN